MEKTRNEKINGEPEANVATLKANGVDMNILDDDKPPLHVFFDTDAMQNTGRHISNLLFAESSFTISGEQCIRKFLVWLDTLTEDDTRKVTMI